MLKLILVIVALLTIIACGHNRDHYYQVPTEVIVPVPTPVEPTPPTDVEKLVAEKNEYRVIAGQLPLTRGLTCTVHETTNPDLTVSLGSAKHTFALMDTFNQPNSSVNDRLNILPEALQAIYLNNFAVRCQGQIVVTESGYYSFELTSDDGSMLYIGGSLVVNNNGNHGAVTVTGAKLLERGVHSFRLDYAQTGGGSQALILTSNGALIHAENFYR